MTFQMEARHDRAVFGTYQQNHRQTAVKAAARRKLWKQLLLVSTVGAGTLAMGAAQAGQLPASAFSTYSAANASSIVAGPTAL